MNKARLTFDYLYRTAYAMLATGNGSSKNCLMNSLAELHFHRRTATSLLKT